MKKLVLSVLALGLVAGSLYANDSHNMSKEKCMNMHKEFHKSESKKVEKSLIPQSVLDTIYPDDNLDR